MERQFDFIMAFWDCPKPTIALVHGFCMAGAFEVALACDITIAAEGTRFGEPEVRFGTGIVAMLLPWAVLPKHAKEMLLTGNDKMDAARAAEIGIVNHVVAGDELLEAGRRMGLDIAAAAGPSVFFTKRAMNRTYEIMGMREALTGVARYRCDPERHSKCGKGRVPAHPQDRGAEGGAGLAGRTLFRRQGLSGNAWIFSIAALMALSTHCCWRMARAPAWRRVSSRKWRRC